MSYIGLAADVKHIDFIIDSGANYHYVAGDPTALGLKPELSSIKVATADGRSFSSLSCKDLNVVSNKDKVLKLNCLHVSEFPESLLSVSQLTKAGYTCVFEKDLCKVLKDGNVVATAHLSSRGLWHCPVTIQCPTPLTKPVGVARFAYGVVQNSIKSKFYINYGYSYVTKGQRDVK